MLQQRDDEVAVPVEGGRAAEERHQTVGSRERARVAHQAEPRVRPALALERHEPGESSGRDLASEMDLDAVQSVERLLAVGDAAGLVKPTTGGGIYYSLISGRLAAETLDEALAADDLREARLRRYETEWRARLGADIRIGLAFRTLASRLNDRAIDAVVELARVDGIVPLLRETADFNWHRQSALALLKHAQFRKILLSSLWG